MTAQPSQSGQRKTQDTKQPENRETGQSQGEETSQGQQNAPAQPQQGQTGQPQGQETSQREQNAPAQPQQSQTGQRQGGATEQRGRGETGLARRDDGRQPSPAGRRRAEMGEVFDPRTATGVALVRLARNWHRAGSTYQAIHAYTQVLIRYPGTGAASLAVEELLELAETLEQQGRFHAALNIFNQLEQLT